MIDWFLAGGWVLCLPLLAVFFVLLAAVYVMVRRWWYRRQALKELDVLMYGRHLDP